MLLVLHVSAVDRDLALLNVQLAAKLDVTCSLPVLLAAPIGLDVIELEARLRAWCPSSSTFRYDDWGGDHAWPRPQNWAWQSVARYMATRQPAESWLWWEADATPLRSGWFTALADAHRDGAKPFAGHLVVGSTNGHLNGVAIYPADVRPYSSGAFLTRAAPFDRFLSQAIVPRHVHALNDLMGHHVKEGRASFEATEEAVAALRASPLVLFHGSSDGALARALLAKPPSLLARVKGAFFTAPPAKPLIPLSCHLDSSSGYGIYSAQIALELLSRGYSLEIQSPAWNENGAPLPAALKGCMLSTPRKHDFELVIYPCVIQPKGLVVDNPNTAYLTMWESTRLVSKADAERTQAVNVLNRCRVVLTPNAWNASVFSSCGVDTPIRLVPLGTDLALFPETRNDVRASPLVFGTAARTHFGGIRKGFNLVVAAFRLAFPSERDVLLRIKCFAEDPLLDTGGDKRIEQFRGFLTIAALADWYRSINVFVSGSASEGWGRHQQEAMCMGRPVIGIAFGGVTEFFNEENGYACDWRLAEGEGIYRTMGHYAKPTVEGLAAQMRLAYEDRRGIKRKGLLAAASARRFTIANSADRILAALREFKMLS